ncbi:MAG: ankyrin repeat domain-containing protein [Spirochaetia bacterium]|nr:ankyrin repeat domain-containing protein [Spirochaetia bacterium]
MSVEERESSGGRYVLIAFFAICSIVGCWIEFEGHYFLKIITTILILIGCFPLGLLGYKIGNAITMLFCPDAILTTSAVRGRLYFLAWRILPRLLCVMILVALPIGLMQVFGQDESDNSQEYSENTYQDKTVTNNKVAAEENVFTIMAVDAEQKGLDLLAAGPRVFLCRDSKWVLYLYVANAEFNSWTVYTETKKLDGSDLDTITKTTLCPEILNNDNYIINCCRNPEPEYIVKTQKGNYYSVSTRKYSTVKSENDSLKFLKEEGIIKDKKFKPSEQLLDICSGKKDTSNIDECIMFANLNITNKDGSTPLILACQNRLSDDIINKLIAFGADLNIKNKKGQTALYWAKSNNLDWIVAVLKSAGAKE